jgi:hypothetical protein
MHRTPSVTKVGAEHRRGFLPGPIVRVNPDELSIHDADFYNEIYVTESKRRTNAYDIFCKGIDFDGKFPASWTSPPKIVPPAPCTLCTMHLLVEVG